MDTTTPRFKTIRQTAATHILSEHHLRLMLKQGRLPGFFVGNRFLVNVPKLEEQLDAVSVSNTRTEEKA